MKNKNHTQKIFEIFEKNNPNPKTELIYFNEFSLLIAIMLSAQTTDKMVNKATEKIFDFIKKPSDMLDFGLENFQKTISCLNFYKTKAKNVLKTSQILFEEFHDSVPINFDDLIKLPGVGRKTANVFLSIMNKDEKRIGIDTHVSRVSFRLGFVDSQKNLKIIEESLIKQIPENFFHNAHHWLVLHGRYICKSQKPLCENCPLSEFCDFFRKKKV
jgi:endonuclease-3